MKKAFLMVLACLLLAGCGAPPEAEMPIAPLPVSPLAATKVVAA